MPACVPPVRASASAMTFSPRQWRNQNADGCVLLPVAINAERASNFEPRNRRRNDKNEIRTENIEWVDDSVWTKRGNQDMFSSRKNAEQTSAQRQVRTSMRLLSNYIIIMIIIMYFGSNHLLRHHAHLRQTRRPNNEISI